MLIISWNIRGLSSRPKISAVKRLLNQHNANFIFLQETKMEIIQPRTIKAICNEEEVDWIYSPSNGNSGGLLSLWKTSFFTLHSYRIEKSWIAIIGKIEALDSDCALINIYNPCNPSDRASIWDDLHDLWLSWAIPWVITGDFNEVLNPSERGSQSASISGMNCFNEFIQNLSLIEISGDVGAFTWFRGNSRSKLDRALINHEIQMTYPNISLKILQRGLSDHCPILLFSSLEKNWGPRPFRFLNCWLDDPSCAELIKQSWLASNSSHPMEKLKILKGELKSWNLSTFGNIDEKIKELEEKIHSLDLINNLRSLDNLELSERRAAQIELWKWAKRKESAWAQKSRALWLKEGDRNTKFFHSYASSRKRRNTIKSITCNGEVLEEPEDIRREVNSFFQGIFKEEHNSRPTFLNLNFRKISREEGLQLVRPFSNVEVDEAVFSCESSKSPGPDGFNFKFIKSSWNTIKHDVYKIVNAFWLNGSLPRGCNTAFIALIPKIASPTELKDYRPISMIGCFYKIISKILSHRLQKVIHNVVGPQQSAFIHGRQILDGALIAGEIIDSCKKRKTPATFFKLDFHKAFDCVSWNFLEWTLIQMEFPQRWIKWIISCVTSASASILVNGSPTTPFKLQRGLRQGDPLSPFLFNLVAETLNLLISRAVSMNSWEGLQISQHGPSLTHLQYADDTLIFCPAKLEYLINIKKTLILFQLASGLQVNFHKSCLIGINMQNSILQDWARILLCKVSSLPMTFLGLPVGGSPSKAALWEPIIDRLNKKLASWKGKLLSPGGRLTLIKACLSNIPIYYMSIYPMPKMIIQKLEQIQRRFLWSGSQDGKSMALASWESLQWPKQFGGLNLGNLQHKNLALLFKWVWRFFNGEEEQALWCQVIRDKYKYQPAHKIHNLEIPSARGPWKNICSNILRDDQSKRLTQIATRKRVGDGSNTLFWYDLWIGEAPLKLAFPRLFLISSHQTATISSLGLWNGLTWQWHLDWKRNFRTRDQEEWQALHTLLQQAALSPSSIDTLAWLPAKMGFFSVKSFSLELAKTNCNLHPSVLNRVWANLVPHRIEFFCWLAILGKLNTKSKLATLQIIPDADDVCVLCNNHSETSSHLFLHCETSWKLWSWWFDLWSIDWVVPNSLVCLLSQWAHPSHNKFFRKVWLAGYFIILWSIWKERNERVFNQNSTPLLALQELVILRLSWWIKGWGDHIPYSHDQILRNPKCLAWVGRRPRHNAALIPPEVSAWSAPPHDTFKWNIDASLNIDSSTCAIGGVLRDHEGNFLCLFSSPIPSMDINSAEVFAIHRAIRISMARPEFQRRTIILESDSKNAVSWCNNPRGGPWNLSFILNYVRSHLLRGNFTLTHKGRESNGVADHLAKQGIHRCSNFTAWMM